MNQTLKEIRKLRWSFIFNNWNVHDSIDVFRSISPNLLLSRSTLLKRFCLKLDCNCNNRIAIQNLLVRAKFVIKRRGRRQVWWQTVRHITFTIRVRPRFFDEVGNKTMYAFSGNKHFFTKSCHCQTYQNYEQSRQKLGPILENNWR